MKKRLALLIALATASAAQAPVPVDQEPFHKVFFSNEQVRAMHVEIPPQQASQLHVHERDNLVVSLTDASYTSAEVGKAPEHLTRKRGEARLSKAGLVHSVRNDGNAPFRTTLVEFSAPQGEAKQLAAKTSRYCNAGSKTACVTEDYLFCTDKVCVSSVEFGPGAVTEMHRHATAHMVIAITDLDMRDEAQGRPSVQRGQKSGDVVYVPAGITHALVNGPATARFITVVWK